MIRVYAVLLMGFLAFGNVVRADHIAFFYALEADLQGFKTVAREIGQSVTVGSRRIQRLRLDSHTVYAVKMGSGCVETAASAQALLSRFPCDWAFSLGPAGALTDEVETGGWCRITEMTAWQKGVADATGFSPASSESWKGRWERLPELPLLPPLDTTQTLLLASGELFVAAASERDRIHAATGAGLVDMNHFGLAAVCADHGVPLFTWKVVSDKADEEASAAFRTFTQTYDGSGGRALAEMLQSLPANPNDPLSYPHIEELLRETGRPSDFTIPVDY